MSQPFVEIRRREKCDTCAFRPGTEANASDLTMMKARLCAEAAVPFLCHEDTTEVMCSGFCDLMQSRVDHKVERPEWQSALAVKLLGVIDAAEDADKSGKPQPNPVELIMKAIDELAGTDV